MTIALNIADENGCPSALDGSKSVLIVDDEAMAAEEMAEALGDAGFRCFIASSADEARTIFHGQPDITAVITDFYLKAPGFCAGNGLELVETLRAELPDRMLDCIVISGDPEVLADCVLFGGVKFLAKPVLPDSLATLLCRNIDEDADQSDYTISLDLLQRRIQDQSRVITALSRNIKADQAKSDAMSFRLDRLNSAALILRNRVEDEDNGDVISMVRYIAEQGMAIRGML